MKFISITFLTLASAELPLNPRLLNQAHQQKFEHFKKRLQDPIHHKLLNKLIDLFPMEMQSIDQVFQVSPIVVN